MGKKRKNRRRRSGNGASGANPKTSTPSTVSAPAKPDVDELEATARSAGLTINAPMRTPEGDEMALRDRLQSLIETYTRASNAYTHAAAESKDRYQRLEARQQALNEQSAQLDSLAESLKDQRIELDRQREALRSDQDALVEQRRSLAERQEAVQAREADADAGFVTRRERALEELQQAHNALLERNTRLHEQITQREQAHLERVTEQQDAHNARLEAFRSKVQEQLEQQSQEHMAALNAREQDLAQAEADLKVRERTLKRAQFEAHEATADAEDLRHHVEQYIEKRTEACVQETQQELQRERESGEALRARIKKLETRLKEQTEAAKLIEDMSPEAVRRRIDKQKARIEELELELADRPTQGEAEELDGLRQQRTAWEQERRSLMADKGRLESRLESLMIEVDAVQLLRDRNMALVENQRLLRAALDDLRADIDERLDKHAGKPIFPEMLHMDADEHLSQGPTRLFPAQGPLDLGRFTTDLQHRIGRDLRGERPDLYYRIKDVRAFVAGLAMSRLHLLQGISGIGKSSLPRAFADAIGGLCKTVSVQAGWRDRNDLFGHFNAFERRYYESPFVQALYRAQTPLWEDRIVIILLDEMNLSHPEQYGADVLDVLERRERSGRRFELLSFTPTGETPTRLVDKRHLPLPDNVWFVGTANHDETTKDFADKTYDRSFVMELPGRPAPFELRKPKARPPLSHKALAEAFDSAASSHRQEANEAITWMEKHLKDPMQERFRVGWGGRLENQMRRYVPVVMASGGSLGEALDALVTTRVLRKIQGRHDNLEEDLEHIVGVLEQTWPDKDHEAIAARRLLDGELRHLRG